MANFALKDKPRNARLVAIDAKNRSKRKREEKAWKKEGPAIVLAGFLEDLLFRRLTRKMKIKIKAQQGLRPNARIYFTGGIGRAVRRSSRRKARHASK